MVWTCLPGSFYEKEEKIKFAVNEKWVILNCKQLRHLQLHKTEENYTAAITYFLL